MSYLEVFVKIIITGVIFIPIEKRYKLCSKYHNRVNRRFKTFTVAISLLSLLIINILINSLLDNNFKIIGITRYLILFIFEIPFLFVLWVDFLTIHL
jgi:hypothetical protein